MSKPNINEIAPLMQKQIENYYIDAHSNWIHRGTQIKTGYVYLSHTRKNKNYKYAAHRLSYALYKGYVSDNMFVCHTCDIPNCINPDHLYLATQKNNLLDMSNKGRGKNQLDEDIIGFIIVLRKRGYSQPIIAKHLGISQSTVSKYLRKAVS